MKVSLRTRELKNQLYDRALSIIVAKIIKRGILFEMRESEVTNEDYANLIVFGHIGKVTESPASKFGFITTVTRTSPAIKTTNDIVMDDASELPTYQSTKSQNNNHAPQEPPKPLRTGNGPLEFSFDFIETKKSTSKNLSTNSRTKIRES